MGYYPGKLIAERDWLGVKVRIFEEQIWLKFGTFWQVIDKDLALILQEEIGAWL